MLSINKINNLVNKVRKFCYLIQLNLRITSQQLQMFLVCYQVAIGQSYFNIFLGCF